MARLADAGLGAGGNWIKGEELLARGDVFDVIGAKYEPKGKYGKAVILTIRFQDTAEVSEREVRQWTLPYNEVRQKYLDWFNDPLNAHEPLTSNICTQVSAPGGLTFNCEELPEIEPGVVDPAYFQREQ